MAFNILLFSLPTFMNSLPLKHSVSLSLDLKTSANFLSQLSRQLIVFSLRRNSFETFLFALSKHSISFSRSLKLLWISAISSVPLQLFLLFVFSRHSFFFSLIFYTFIRFCFFSHSQSIQSFLLLVLTSLWISLSTRILKTFNLHLS